MTLNGTNHGGDAVTQQAKNDLTTAYNEAAGSGPPIAVPTGELGGLTLTPGVYNGATLQITGTLTLDTLGDPAAVFIFQSGATLITASDSAVVVLGGGTACNVFWQVTSSATLGTNSHLIGSVLALTSITATTGATIDGRLLARNGAVTLDTNTITAESCAASTTTTTPGATTTTTPGATTTIAAATTSATAAGPGGRRVDDDHRVGLDHRHRWRADDDVDTRHRASRSWPAPVSRAAASRWGFMIAFGVFLWAGAPARQRSRVPACGASRWPSGGAAPLGVEPVPHNPASTRRELRLAAAFD